MAETYYVRASAVVDFPLSGSWSKETTIEQLENDAKRSIIATLVNTFGESSVANVKVSMVYIKRGI